MQNKWPELPYEKFSSTAHLLHMCTQIMGKIKLLTPFEPEWANVILHITAQGVTTGLIPYQSGAFSMDMDLITHEVRAQTTTGLNDSFKLESMAVSELYNKIFRLLKNIGILLTINPHPQEIANPIPFEKNTEIRNYARTLANAWWRILVNSYLVMQRYHATFLGKTQPIGLMWGTFDLRDVRFKDPSVILPGIGINAGYLRRNAMDAEQIECGWWSGSPAYPRAAYYSFTYPEPANLDQINIQPSTAHWDKTQRLFILDYDDLLKSTNPDEDLFTFLESSYHAGAEAAGWNRKLIGSGKPL